MNNQNIVLIGLMGCGKTSTGKLIAESINYEFIDIDQIIEQREGTSISEIFKTKGEPYFRQLEVDTIEEFSQLSNQVISTGGGAPENPANMKNLAHNGIVFYLYAPVDELYKRLISEMTNRPMLKDQNPQQKLQLLLERRESYYLKADYKIDTSYKTLEEISKEIISIFNGAQNESNKTYNTND